MSEQLFSALKKSLEIICPEGQVMGSHAFSEMPNVGRIDALVSLSHSGQTPRLKGVEVQQLSGPAEGFYSIKMIAKGPIHPPLAIQIDSWTLKLVEIYADPSQTYWRYNPRIQIYFILKKENLKQKVGFEIRASTERVDEISAMLKALEQKDIPKIKVHI